MFDQGRQLLRVRKVERGSQHRTEGLASQPNCIIPTPPTTAALVPCSRQQPNMMVSKQDIDPFTRRNYLFASALMMWPPWRLSSLQCGKYRNSLWPPLLRVGGGEEGHAHSVLPLLFLRVGTGCLKVGRVTRSLPHVHYPVPGFLP